MLIHVKHPKNTNNNTVNTNNIACKLATTHSKHVWSGSKQRILWKFLVFQKLLCVNNLCHLVNDLGKNNCKTA